jgi:hypothetical protein
MITAEIRPEGGAWFGEAPRREDDARPAKTPRKVNVFESMMGHQGMLEQMPLFPYFGPGDIVPTAALSLSLPEMPRVHFYHYNDITEVIIAMAGDGATLTAGQVYLQKGTHGVTTFLRTPKAKEAQAYQLALIIIRMKQEGPQNEGFILRCHKCNEIVFRMDRDIFEGPGHRYYPELPNLRFYADAVDAFNAEERTCAACGVVQAKFPQELMGWRRYAQYAELANRARSNIEAAAAPPPAPAAAAKPA